MSVYHVYQVSRDKLEHKVTLVETQCPFLYINDQFALENIKHLRGIAGSIFGISITWIIWKCNNVEQGHWNINQGS